MTRLPPSPDGARESDGAPLSASATGAMMERLGIEWLEMSPERVVARIPVEGNTQPYGILHGGATAALCETVGSVGTAVAIGAQRFPVGMELNINHLRSAAAGWVTATGVPVHVGRRTAVWDMRVHDDDGRLIAVSRLTLALMKAPRALVDDEGAAPLPTGDRADPAGTG